MKIIKESDEKVIDEAVSALGNGGLIIYPTETAYGVGVDATNSEAVSRLLKYKKRPEGKAISIGVYDEKMASEYVEINESAKNIYKEFLPGPVTVISKSKGKIDKRLESEKETVGIRIPNKKIILEIIRRFGKPVTTTSANSSGKKTPYSVSTVLDTLSEKQKELIDLIIDGGELPKRLTSTVIDTTTAELKTYRKGELKFGEKEIVFKFETNSAEETIMLGKKFVEDRINLNASKPIIFLLRGDLGAGKTHFTKGIALGLGIDRIIKSPTYTYVEEYIIPSQASTLKNGERKEGVFFHVDAWKIESKNDLDMLGFEKWLKPGNVISIEWPEIIENFGYEFENGEVFDLEFTNGRLGSERIINVR